MNKTLVYQAGDVMALLKQTGEVIVELQEEGRVSREGICGMSTTLGTLFTALTAAPMYAVDPKDMEESNMVEPVTLKDLMTEMSEDVKA